MRLGIIGDVASATGFGRVTREFGRRWIEAGADVRVLGINHRGVPGEVAAELNRRPTPEGLAEFYRDLTTDPFLTRTMPAAINGDPMGFDVTEGFAEGRFSAGWKADALLVVADPRAMLERLATDGGACSRTRTFNYVPIEGTGLTPFWRDMWSVARPVAMSAFGAREIGSVMGRDDVPVIRHGISDAFHRITPGRPATTTAGVVLTSKAEAKANLGWQDRTVILRTDRHVPRKDYPALFAAIRPVIAARPEVLVVIHCAPVDEGGMLPELVAALPGAWRAPGDAMGWRHSQVILTSAHDTWRGFTDAQLNTLYNAADIYASPTMAEGFGLTLAEAAACGTAVVTTDFAAGPEAVGEGALLVPPARLAANAAGHRWSVTDVPLFTEALFRLVDDPAERDRLGALGEAHVARFDWDAEALRFLRILEEAA